MAWVSLNGGLQKHIWLKSAVYIKAKFFYQMLRNKLLLGVKCLDSNEELVT